MYIGWGYVCKIHNASTNADATIYNMLQYVFNVELFVKYMLGYPYNKQLSDISKAICIYIYIYIYVYEDRKENIPVIELIGLGGGYLC